MRSLKKRLKQEAVLLAVFAGAAITYFMLAGKAWAIYAIVCVAYTIVVVGMVWADGKWERYFGSQSNRIARFIQIHFGFLLAVVLLLWLAIRFEPRMPGWLTYRGGETWSWYHVSIMILVVGLFILEQFWFERPAGNTRS